MSAFNSPDQSLFAPNSTVFGQARQAKKAAAKTAQARKPKSTAELLYDHPSSWDDSTSMFNSTVPEPPAAAATAPDRELSMAEKFYPHETSGVVQPTASPSLNSPTPASTTPNSTTPNSTAPNSTTQSSTGQALSAPTSTPPVSAAAAPFGINALTAAAQNQGTAPAPQQAAPPETTPLDLHAAAVKLLDHPTWVAYVAESESAEAPVGDASPSVEDDTFVPWTSEYRGFTPPTLPETPSDEDFARAQADIAKQLLEERDYQRWYEEQVIPIMLGAYRRSLPDRTRGVPAKMTQKREELLAESHEEARPIVDALDAMRRRRLAPSPAELLQNDNRAIDLISELSSAPGGWDEGIASPETGFGVLGPEPPTQEQEDHRRALVTELANNWATAEFADGAGVPSETIGMMNKLAEVDPELYNEIRFAKMVIGQLGGRIEPTIAQELDFTKQRIVHRIQQVEAGMRGQGAEGNHQGNEELKGLYGDLRHIQAAEAAEASRLEAGGDPWNDLDQRAISAVTGSPTSSPHGGSGKAESFVKNAWNSYVAAQPSDPMEEARKQRELERIRQLRLQGYAPPKG